MWGGIYSSPKLGVPSHIVAAHYVQEQEQMHAHGIVDDTLATRQSAN